MIPVIVLRCKLSDIRHMISVAEGVVFKDMYDIAKDHTYIDGVIRSCDRLAFDKWIKANTEIENLSIRELRSRAAMNRIQSYSRMDKATLLRELKHAT